MAIEAIEDIEDIEDIPARLSLEQWLIRGIFHKKDKIIYILGIYNSLLLYFCLF